MSISPTPITLAGCRDCGYVPFAPGATWGHMDGARGPDECRHVLGQRHCHSCSQSWYRDGAEGEGTWDVDGCERRFCPECVATLVADVGARVTYRRPGGGSTAYTGVVVADTCGECPNSVHVEPDGGGFHHVPVEHIKDFVASKEVL